MMNINEQHKNCQLLYKYCIGKHVKLKSLNKKIYLKYIIIIYETKKVNLRSYKVNHLS